MTEIEKIKYAKSFIDKLANGINPIDDTLAPEQDIINNVRLSRCFFFVSDILRQVIENGGVKKLKKSEKLPFSINQKELESYKFSDNPICMSEMLKGINSLIDTNVMQKLTYADVCEWLIDINLLEIFIDSKGKNRKKPTSQGKNIGITLETRINQRYGDYPVIVYNKDAQKFIIDNIDSIINFKNSK